MQDAPFIIGSTWNNVHGRTLTWKFIQKKWTIISKRYGEGGHFLSRVITPLGNHTQKIDADNAKKFFRIHKAPGTDRTLEQIYEKIYSNHAWLASDGPKLKKWLEK